MHLAPGEWANRPKGWKGQPRPGVMARVSGTRVRALAWSSVGR